MGTKAPLTHPSIPALTTPPTFIMASFSSHNIRFVNIHNC
jgi:hypothetical protein